MHEQATEREREIARPNDRIRAALLGALDVADRAGVALVHAGCTYFVDLDSAPSVMLQGGPAFGQLALTDALRVALRVGHVERRDATAGCPQTTLTAISRTGVQVKVFCEPTYEQLADATAKAALQS